MPDVPIDELPEQKRKLVTALPADTDDLADVLDVKPTTIADHVRALRDKYEYEVQYDHIESVYSLPGESTANITVSDSEANTSDTSDSELPDLSETEVNPDADPDPDNLTSREKYIATELQTGATVEELAEELDERESIITQHLKDLRRSGWRVYIDESADHVAIEGDHALRSSEHKGTRTRKANRWWEKSHNKLVREFRGLETPSTHLISTSGSEDWVTHLTDLHAGDKVRDDAGNLIYSTDEIPDIVDYITEQSLSLADKHASMYDTAHLLWGGDMVTNEGIYEGQFEDLDAWLDEQHDALIDPLVRQLKAFSERFPTVQVVCQVGNHGKHRASGTSRQANADLILYKSIRNTVAQLQQHTDELANVKFLIGEAKPYRNFPLRGGELKGHLRHGQHRKPQAETSARDKEWTKTLLDHDFSIAYMGHFHVSGRIPWDGPPILASSSPKPAGTFVETLGGRVPNMNQGVATAHGVSDDGITGVFPIDTRKYTRTERLSD